jgi:hypothetical protein
MLFDSARGEEERMNERVEGKRGVGGRQGKNWNCKLTNDHCKLQNEEPWDVDRFFNLQFAMVNGHFAI